MYLKRLELQGFKSFATRTLFEFGTGVTAVVGPNGSGKSNVGEAVRWVLGEQQSRNIRARRLDLQHTRDNLPIDHPNGDPCIRRSKPQLLRRQGGEMHCPKEYVGYGALRVKQWLPLLRDQPPSMPDPFDA